MKITRQQVEHISHLARLEIDERETEAFTKQLDSILTFFDTLKEVDTTSIEPTTHAIMVKNVFREDGVVESIPRDSCLDNAPDYESGCFRVPKIIE